MSLFWRNPVGVYLSPQRVLLVRLSAGLRSRRTDECILAVDHNPEMRWQRPLEVLSETLKESRWQGAKLYVVISDHWVRYNKLSPSTDLESETEKLKHAEHVFDGLYGQVANGWTIALSEMAPTLPCIGCAFPKQLYEELSNVVLSNNAALLSVQPQLVSTFNQWTHKLPTNDAWYVTIEQGSLAAVQFTAEGWNRIYTVRIGDDWQLELRRLQKFGQLANAQAGGCSVFVDAPRDIRASAKSVTNTLSWLDDDSAHHNSVVDQLHYLRRTCPSNLRN